MSRKIILSIICALLFPAAFVPAFSDSWRLPEKKKYCSANKKYCLEVIPKQLESQLKYFQEKAEGKEQAGAQKGVKENRAKAVFYTRRSFGGYAKKLEFPLVNEVSPVSALVSDSGGYIVTFDNWHSVGYGDDVVVIYRADGTLVKKFGLEDILTEGDIETLPRSVSSIKWSGTHTLEAENEQLVLQIVTNEEAARNNGVNTKELRIELATGRPLEPKRDLFPQAHPRIFSSSDAGTAAESSSSSLGKPVCASTEESFDSPDLARFSSEELYAKAKERPLPPYPPIAKAARAEGTIVVEILVSKAGDVICARTLSGHALMRSAAELAALKWKFEPVGVAGNPVKAIGRIAFHFSFSGKP